jgi:hypothetical protein
VLNDTSFGQVIDVCNYVMCWRILWSASVNCLVTLALSLTAAPEKGSNIKFTYSHSTCSRRLLPASRQSGIFSPVVSFIGHISEEAAHMEGKHVFTEIRDLCDSNFCYAVIIRKLCIKITHCFLRPTLLRLYNSFGNIFNLKYC